MELGHFVGLAFLPTNDIEDCFVDLMADAPLNDKCSWFDFLENYVTVNSKFPPTIWAAPLDPDTKRTTNGPESFHCHLDVQFYACHPSIFIFLDVLLKIQTTSYIKIRTLHIHYRLRQVLLFTWLTEGAISRNVTFFLRKSNANLRKRKTPDFFYYLYGNVSLNSKV